MPSVLPPELPDRFLVGHALDAGVTRRRLRHPSLAAPFYGGSRVVGLLTDSEPFST